MAIQIMSIKQVVCEPGRQSTPHLVECEIPTLKIGIKRLSSGAKMPTRGSEEAACFDLFVSQDTILPQFEGVLVPTGVAMGIPPGYCVKVYGRSSLCRRGIMVSTGIIDSDYTGEIRVQAFNIGNSRPVLVHAGDRIGQFMLVRLTETELELTDDLRETARGSGGFGSTGK